MAGLTNRRVLSEVDCGGERRLDRDDGGYLSPAQLVNRFGPTPLQ
jgi:hypothetical protein